ncbi:hypothetical protein FNV43_RR26426 [Rhamnella rubrinervis]|uniref:Uncharacterized protein n=1 Tax=Rhamnella rubrinervis TaxID=2594499 RepID=A0A8K0GMH4_9ROSA|nr:hypothetical protein FNV43_RR26426 [Rhamnella rubrinervis]
MVLKEGEADPIKAESVGANGERGENESSPRKRLCGHAMASGRNRRGSRCADEFPRRR